MRLLFLLCGVVMLAGLPQTRSSPAAPLTARLAGAVVEDGATPARPIRRATITLTGTGIATSLQVITDDSGRFVIGNLPAGRFSLTADKPTYIKSYYGSARIGRPPGMPIALAAGQSIDNLTVPLMKGAAISGVVRDTTGVPVAGAQIQVELATIVNGERKLVAPPSGTKLATTDDRGEYRVWGLMPGEYVIRSVGGGATGSGSARVTSAEDIVAATRLISGSGAPLPVQAPPPMARLPSYFPGVIDPAQSQGIPVVAGEERSGMDIVSRIGRVSRVMGSAIAPDGAPVTNMSVGIANVTAGSLYSSPGLVRPNASGQFTVPGLAPGRWLLFGRGGLPDTPQDGVYPWWTQTEVVVGDQDVTGVVLNFSPGSVMVGRIAFEGTSAKPDLTKLRVSLNYIPIINEISTFVRPVPVQPDGSFRFDVVPPGNYRPLVTATPNWSLRSAVVEGRDILDDPLDVKGGQNLSLAITMTDRPTELSGTLLDQLGRPAPEYSVFVFSADRAMWTSSPRRSSGIVKLGSDGRYRVTGLPAGNYHLCVIADVDPNQLSDPAFLEQLSRAAVAVTLVEGEKTIQDLKIGG